MKAIGGLVAALAALAAVAQERDPNRPELDKRADLIRMSDFIGKNVVLMDGTTEVGEVKDVVIDYQRGRAIFAAVAPKDDKNRIVAVPVNKFRVWRKDDGKNIEGLRIEDTKVFADAPHATPEEWDRKDDRAVWGRLAGKGENVEGLARADYLKKASIVDARGERIGEIDAIILNLENARLLALVGVGGVLGVGEKHHVVPWEILRAREFKKEGPGSFTLNVPKEKLEKGPTVKADEVNRLSDPKWLSGVYEHYQYGPLGAGERDRLRVVTAERFLGLDVASAAKPDDEIGSIEGIAVVPHTGKVAYVAFDHEGKLYAVPMEAFKFNWDDDKDLKVTLDATKDSFRGKAPFNEDRWPDRADDSWLGSGARPKDAVPDANRRDGAMAPMILRSRDILDADVKDARRVTFGEIEDFAVDVDSATILFAAVASGGFLGIGETYYAVPWKALSWAGDKDKFFTVNADRKTLERSVEFEAKKVHDPNYIRSVYNVYGLEFERPKAGDRANEKSVR
jgi:sporulation protein YlmC with PRC-barrel domain